MEQKQLIKLGNYGRLACFRPLYDIDVLEDKRSLEYKEYLHVFDRDIENHAIGFQDGNLREGIVAFDRISGSLIFPISIIPIKKTA